MYETYYNLKAMPFQITTDPRFLWLGEKHSEALATLKYGILENKGFLLLTGDVGTGKTALINRLIKMIDVAAIVAKIPDPGLSSLDFFKFLAVEFKIKKEFASKGEFLLQFKNFLLNAYASHKKVLLIIDEAQRLNHELLEQIRLLSNIELNNRKLINIFFVAQTEFSGMLMEQRNRAVRQRITVSYHINPLTEAETGNYIKHRLKVAGAKREIFSKDAVNEVFSFSGGYPRLINIICDHALLTGYASGLTSIDKKVIRECKRELQIPLVPNGDKVKGHDLTDAEINNTTALRPEKASHIRRTGLIAALIMLAVFGIYYFTSQKFEDAPRWSMEEIAPQKYQGPTPKNPGPVDPIDIKASELKEVQQVKKTPLEENAVSKEIQPPENENTAGGPGRQPAAEKVPDQEERQTNVAQKNNDQQPSSKIQEVAPFPERKFLIYFQYNSNELPQEAFETLNRLAAFMLQNPGASINIKGYTDSTGSKSYNVSVSEFRANTIKIYLVGKGIDSSRIKTFGLGSENPIASNETEEGRRKNRRVEIELNAD
jgi:general secretion pathway protein A